VAKNTGNGYRRGAVDKRSQTYNPVTERQFVIAQKFIPHLTRRAVWDEFLF